MSTAIAKIYELQTGHSLNDALNDVHSLLHDTVPDTEWVDKIQVMLESIDFNSPDMVRSLADSLQKTEKRKHTKSAPGTGQQLAFDDLTPEWAENSGISFDGNYIKWIDAKKQHAFEYMKQRQQQASDMADAAVRAVELYELTSERGGLKAALKRRGVDGW